MTSSDTRPADDNGDSRHSCDATHSASSTADSPPAQLASAATQQLTLRQSLRQRRDSLSAASVAEHSHLIARQLLPLLQDAQHIAGYLALGNEVNVEEVLRDCRSRQAMTYVPLIQADHTLLFAPLDDNTGIVQNKYGIREPAPDARECIAPLALDAVLVPLLGFDPQCNRMGMGGGYYDRSFTHRRHAANASAAQDKPLLVGVAHQRQCVDSLETQWWDVPLDLVVTESRIYRRNSE